MTGNKTPKMIYHIRLKHLFPILLLVIGCSEETRLKNTLSDYQVTLNKNYSHWENPAPLFLAEKDSIDIFLKFLRSAENQLMTIDTLALELSAYAIWQNELQFIREKQEQWSNLFSNPAAFDVTGHFTGIINGSDNIEEKLSMVSAALELIPAHFEKAKKIITAPDPSRSSLAVQKQLLFLRFLQIDLPDLMKTANLPAEKRQELTSRIRKAKLASKDYIGFCESLIFEHFDSTLIRPQQE
jgi:hypothetical protein